jgi:Holliday junction resolvase
MNRNYIRGRAKEYRLKAKLEKEGWGIVLRTAGSHGPFDLIAIRKSAGVGWIRLIQVKSGKSRKRESRKALKEIEKFTGSYSVTAEVF